MAEIEIDRCEQCIELETSNASKFEVEFQFQENENDGTVYTLTFDPSLYLDKTICSRGDFTFDNVEKAINRKLEKTDLDKNIGYIYNIEVKEIDKFKRTKNPGWQN